LYQIYYYYRELAIFVTFLQYEKILMVKLNLPSMVICPSCGNEADSSQDFCRDCGENIEDVEEVKQAKIHFRDDKEPISCDKISYPSMGGNWIRAFMDDASVRIYPIDRIEYVEATSGFGKAFAEAEPGNLQVKEVSSFDSLGKALDAVGDIL
jgi:hypothetical protein